MLDLRSYIVNDELVIEEPQWHVLNESYSRDEIKEAISEVIQDLPLPLLEFTEEEVREDFKNLKNLDTKSLLFKGKLHSKCDYRYPLSSWYVNNTMIGRKSSKYFHQRARWKVQHARYISPYRAWTEKKFHKTFLNPLWTLEYNKVNRKSLRQSIEMRMYVAAQFPPAVAKTVYDLFESKNVLDFSSGWGDRLAGFHASGAETYYGIDPNQEVWKNYFEQNKFYNTGKGVIAIQKPAEDVDLGEQKFDTVFTSPPYFHVEHYSDDETQSWKRYGKNLDVWLNEFLYTVLERCWNALDDSGTMIINIADIYTQGGFEKICDPMNDFIGSLPGSHYCGCLGLRIVKRPGKNSIRGNDDRDSKAIEPMWVWKKNDDRPLADIIDSSFPLSKFFE